MTYAIILNYQYAYESIKGYIHAVTDDARAACGLSGALIINSSYKYRGSWDDDFENRCALCVRRIERMSK